MKKILINLIVLFFVAFVAFIINRFPINTSIASGDFYQLLNPSIHVYRYFYMWINEMGQGVFNTLIFTYPFYSILSIVSIFKFNSNTITSFYMFFILYFSYLSFYLSIRFIYPSIREITRVGGGLIYAFNNFTLGIFMYSWGYSHQFLVYIFYPLLVLFFVKIISDSQKISKSVFFIYLFISLLATVSYNNIAFLGVLFLSYSLILFFLFVTRQLEVNFLLLKKLLLIVVIILSQIGIILYPIINYLFRAALNSKVVGVSGNSLLSWLMATPSNFLNSFLFSIDSSRFPINNFSFLSATSFFYISILLLLLVISRKNKIKDQRVLFTFMLLYLIFLFLSIRSYSLFSFITLPLYTNKFFALFRSADKIYSIIPLFYSALLVGLIETSHIRQKFVVLIFFLLILIPFPFYLGSIPKYLSVGNNGYSSNIKIPEQYYESAKIINHNNLLTSIVSLPYSVVNSTNWSNYPKWNFVGQDILELLFNKQYVSSNSYANPIEENKFIFKGFNDKKESSTKLLNLIQDFSGQYVFYHKDIDPTWIKKTTYVSNSLKELTVQKKLALVDSNSYFDLYKVLTPYLTPLIHASSTPMSFERVNPTEYKVYATINKSDVLVFNQTFDNQWKLYLNQYPTDNWCTNLSYYKAYSVEECAQHSKFILGNEFMYLFAKPVFNTSHTMVNSYANAWQLDKRTVINNYSKNYYKLNKDGSVSVEMTLYYTPQTNFYVELMIQALTFVGCISYFGYLFIRKGIKKQ